MLKDYWANGKKISLEVDEDVVAVRYREPAPYSIRSASSTREELGSFVDRLEVPGEKFTILPVAQSPEPRPARHNAALSAMAETPDVSRVAPVFKLGGNQVIATDRILMGFNAGSADADKVLSKVKGEVTARGDDEYLVQLSEDQDPFAVAKELMSNPAVAYAEPDFVTIGRHVSKGAVSATIMDPLLDRQYAMKLTQAIDAWQVQDADPNICIAILDEGVDTVHADLRARIAGGFDATDGDAYQEPNAWDAHGTACAGLAAAVPGNGVGVRGVAGGCSILAVRIAKSDYPQGPWKTSNGTIANAVDWSWRNNADVLSNSWGGGPESTAIANSFERARTQGRNGKGCVIVIAAGNDNGPVNFPANLPNVLTISASNEYDEPKTPFSADGENWWGSCFGPEVDVAAPGVHNYTTDISGSAGYNQGMNLPDGSWLHGDYTHNFNGTSSSTPIVAGAAAMVLSKKASLTEQQVRDAIKSTADKVGSVSYANGRNDRMGHGRVNVRKALDAV